MAEILNFLQEQEDAGGRVRAALASAGGLTLEQVNRAKEVGYIIGQPSAAVMVSPEYAEREFSARRISQSSELARFAGESPDNAVFARENTDGLKSLVSAAASTFGLGGVIGQALGEDVAKAPLYIGRGRVNVGTNIAGIALASLDSRLQSMRDNPSAYQNRAADESIFAMGANSAPAPPLPSGGATGMAPANVPATAEAAEPFDVTATPEYQRMLGPG